MEKRVLLAAILSAMFLSLYSTFIMKSAAPPAKTRLPQNGQQPVQPELPGSYLHPLDEEEVTTIESQDLQLEIGNASGAVRRATLKRFTESSGTQPLQIGGPFPLLRVHVGEAPTSFRLVQNDQRSITIEAMDSKQNSYYILYSLSRANNLIDIELRVNSLHHDTNSLDVTLVSTWPRFSKESERYNPLEVFMLSKNSKEKLSYKKYVSGVRQETIVPRGTFLVSFADRHFCHSLKLPTVDAQVRLLTAPEGTLASAATTSIERPTEGILVYSATAYIGPRGYFYLKKAGLGEAFPIGAIGQIGLILLLMLNWIAGVTRNYGLAIILFSLFITLLTCPLTLVSMRSMKKMQQLKPQMDRIMAQHKHDQAKANQEIFALYRQQRVSPLSGCLPVVLQMPIFIALFQAMSHFVELRGKPFLWIRDLSLPDRLAQLPVALPILGRDVNLLPLIMAGAMYFQTKLSQQSAGASEANPTMKMLSGPIMPIIFSLMFYNFPAGLVLYWLTNTLASLAVYRLVK